MTDGTSSSEASDGISSFEASDDISSSEVPDAASSTETVDDATASGTADGTAASGTADGNPKSGPADGADDEHGGDADEVSGESPGQAGPEEGSEDGSYSGVLGAVPYAFRTSESRLFRSYAVLGGLLSGLVVILFGLALVDLIGGSASAAGGTFTFSRAFFVVLMLLVVGPLVAPVLSVARRHRRTGSTVAYDRAMAASGYVFLASLYLMLVTSVPAEQQDPPTGAFGPVVAFLYDLPQVAGVVSPLLAVAVLYAVHRRFS